MKPEYVHVVCNAKGVTTTHSLSVEPLGEAATRAFAELFVCVRGGDMTKVLSSVAVRATMLKLECGLNLSSVVISRVDGEIDVSVLFELEVKEG